MDMIPAVLRALQKCCSPEGKKKSYPFFFFEKLEGPSNPVIGI